VSFSEEASKPSSGTRSTRSSGSQAFETAKSCHSPSSPLSRREPRSTKAISDPATRSLTVLDTRICDGSASPMTREAMCTPIPATSRRCRSTSPACIPARMSRPMPRRSVRRRRTRSRSRRGRHGSPAGVSGGDTGARECPLSPCGSCRGSHMRLRDRSSVEDDHASRGSDLGGGPA
jgi:hypothetical protein